MRSGYVKEKKHNVFKTFLAIAIFIIIIGGGYFLFTYFSNNNNESSNSASAIPSVSASNTPSDAPSKDPIEEQLKSMTLEEKVGQMIMATFRKDENDNNITKLSDTQKKIIEDIKPGGIVLFGTNISDIDQVKKYISDVQKSSKIPMFISVDQEGGVVQRLTNTQHIGATKIPSMLRVGNMNDVNLTLSVAKVMASELKVFGFNMDYSPDTDIFSNPKNTIIGDRAFGKNADIVKKMAPTFAEGLKSENIIPVFKHFPGHGDTLADTHKGTVILNKSLEELENLELIPFKAAIEKGADCIMVAHITLPKIDKDNTPASLSYEVVTNILRKKLGYNGIVMTDGLDSMKAITDNYSDYEVGVKAVKAGVDILLIPRDMYKAKQGIIDAVKNNEISEERINESVRRILKLKEKYNVTKEPKLNDISILGSKEHLDIINKIK